jgi:predicted  nucleic acid-binding Zn-ribbon protein
LPEQIARLMDLQVLDRQLQELEQTLGTIAGKVESLREESARYEAELQRLTEEDQQAAAARKKAEKELAEGEARIRNKRMRLNLVRTDKELQALTLEVESLKDTNQRLESELLALAEAADPRTARIKELGELIAKGRAELAEAEKEIAAQVEELKASISQKRRERDKAAAEIQPNLLQRYNTLFTRRQGIAVALAKGGSCMGCRRLLPPQLYNEIQKHAQIHFCPNCQRILYFEERRAEQEN